MCVCVHVMGKEKGHCRSTQSVTMRALHERMALGGMVCMDGLGTEGCMMVRSKYKKHIRVHQCCPVKWDLCKVTICASL